MMNALSSQDKITVTRTLRVKTMITDAFRERAAKEDETELEQIDSQITQLREVAQKRLHELEQSDLSQDDKNMGLGHLQQQFDQDMMTLLNSKQDVLARKETLAKTQNGTYVTTGELRDTVELKVGDTIYEKLRGGEILVKDGVITAIIA